MFICGAFTRGTRKSCKMCKYFFLWGVSAGYCDKHREDMLTWNHCKYYKRDSEIWFKDGRCKVDENLLYC